MNGLEKKAENVVGYATEDSGFAVEFYDGKYKLYRLSHVTRSKVHIGYLNNKYVAEGFIKDLRKLTENNMGVKPVVTSDEGAWEFADRQVL